MKTHFKQAVCNTELVKFTAKLEVTKALTEIGGSVVSAVTGVWDTTHTLSINVRILSK